MISLSDVALTPIGALGTALTSSVNVILCCSHYPTGAHVVSGERGGIGD